MGWLRIRKKDFNRAASRQNQDPDLSGVILAGQNRNERAAAMQAYVKDAFRNMRYRFVRKKHSTSRFSRLTTTYYRQVRLGSGWPDYSPAQRAILLTHEIVHARQWRYYGRAKFGIRYVASARFRWAVEVQAYREGIRAKRLLGYSRDNLIRTAERRAASISKIYSLRALRDVRRKTRTILMKEVPRR